MALYELLESRQSEVLSYWLSKVQATLAPESLSPVELVDHVPDFLQELTASLRNGAGSDAESASASDHGEYRLRQGFSLASVVREYGILIDAITATAKTAGVSVSAAEHERMFLFTTEGIARAVSEYSTQREADLRRQANEHFAFIAHELRSPLSAAMSFLEVMRLQEALPEKTLANGLERNLKRTAELIDHALRTSRVASGVDLQRKPTTLAALFQTSEADVLPTATLKNVAFEVIVQNDTLIEVDLRLARSAIDNLLRNAIKHTRPQGTITLRGDIVDGRAVIEVEDTCGGLEPGASDEIFKPFVRGDSQQPGFGLGLSITQQAVEAHGGTIRVQNLPGKGCVFVMDLPISERRPIEPTREPLGGGSVIAPPLGS